MSNIDIKVDLLTRVEGHGNIVVNATDGKIEKLLWEVVEAPRLFEAMLRGRYYDDVAHIACRICGICSIAHTTCSLKATEAAFGVKVSEQTLLLRKLMYDAEILESHILHYYFLVAPDLLGVDSVLPLASTHKDVVLRALNLKKLSFDMGAVLGGRKTHPVTMVVGGFSHLPTAGELKDMQQKLKEALPELEATVELFKTLSLPDFVRETEYISLKDSKEYAFVSGDIFSSDAGKYPISSYREVSNEFCVPQSTAKYTKNKRDSYMVGALARFNNNYAQLYPKAQKAASELALRAPCHNPFMISVAQVIETIHAAEEAIEIINKLLKKGLKEEKIEVKPKAGRGVGAVEAPRGILFHDYTYNDKGIIQSANCVIPTNQNHNNIQKDFESLVPQILSQPQDKVRLTLEMLVRAYDPCISCSAHLIDLG
jgi:coenzyme F420-reducing hydrogenase alpha subunit